jgi:hypothetical protein
MTQDPNHELCPQDCSCRQRARMYVCFDFSNLFTAVVYSCDKYLEIVFTSPNNNKDQRHIRLRHISMYVIGLRWKFNLVTYR